MDNNIKIPPHNIYAEQSILGSFLLDEHIYYKMKFIKSEFFYKEAHRIIYECMIKITNDNKIIDLIILADELRNIGYLDHVGGISYITSLSTIVPTTLNIDYYIGIIKDNYLKRSIIKKCNQIIDSSYESCSIYDILNEIDSIRSVANDYKNIEDSYIDGSTIKRDKDADMHMETGFTKLDCILGKNSSDGIAYGSLTVLTGEPASGKSTILNQFMAESISQGNKAFIYSGELPSYQLMEWFVRSVSNEYHLKTCKNKLGVEYKFVTDYVWDLISEWIENKLYIYGDDAKANEDNLISVIEHLYIKKGVRLFILDNLMTMEMDGGREKYENQKRIASQLKNLAKKYKLVIILVAHPKKPTGLDRPSMYDVSGASEMVGVADYVIRTTRAKKDDESSTSGIFVLKNRINGKQDIFIKTYFDENRKRIYTDFLELNKDYGYDKNKQFIQVEVDSPF